MRFQGSIIKEQVVTFAIAIVKPHVLNSSMRPVKQSGHSFQSLGMCRLS